MQTDLRRLETSKARFHGPSAQPASRTPFNRARFSLYCFLTFFSAVTLPVSNKSPGLTRVDILIFVLPPVTSKVYKVCESIGPDNDLNPYLLSGSDSMISLFPFFRRSMIMLCVSERLFYNF